MKIQVKEMTLSHLEQIKDILYSQFDDFWSYNTLQTELQKENVKYIIAESEGEIVGFAGLWIIIDEAQITNIVTKKSYRNNGVGSILLNELIQICNNLNINNILLEVNENNLPAIKLYEKYGFTKIGARKNYYNFSQTAIQMQLLLKTNKVK